MKQSRIKVGDYVELLENHGGNVWPGEQGIVIDEYVKEHIFDYYIVLFPTNPAFREEPGYIVPISKLKRVYRPR